MYLVLAYGNPLRRDDGVAWRAAELLTTRLEPARRARGTSGSIDIRMLHQLTPELSEDVAAADGVVFLDARSDGVPGEIRVSSVDSDGGVSSSFAHSVAPGMLLTLGQHLFGRTPPAALVTVTGESFELGEELSPVVGAAVDDAVDEVIALLAIWEDSRGDSRGRPDRS